MADVLEQLRDAAGGDAHEATGQDAVGGMPPRWVVRPGSTEQASAVLAAASAHDLTVVPRGTGTKLGWGAAPERVDVVLDTTRMDAIVEHAAGDLICVVGAGRRLDSLQAELGRAGQRLGIDSARPGTVGGAVATATTGPTRLYHGSVRDLVIGMTLVRADGVVAHAGGKVVKNVAGYDLGKLMTGSFGTLGVITQVAFRLHPVPADQRWVDVTLSAPESGGDGASGGVRSAVQQRVLALTHCQAVPSAVELDWSAGQASLSVLLEGVPPGVEARTGQVRELLGGEASDSAQAPSWWGREPESESGVLLKVTFETAGLSRLLTVLETAGRSAGVAPVLRGSPLVGTAIVGLKGEGTGDASGGEVTTEQLSAFVAALRSAARGFGGSVVVIEAPTRLRDGLDVWGPVSALELMRAVKSQFDPERRLAPGRFVGGI